MKTIKSILFLSPLLFMASACMKEINQQSGKSTYSVRMTDAPGPYDSVMIDVQSVIVKSDGKSDVTLNTKAGMYNLLTLSNGKDTLLATGSLEAGTVSQIRLILGPNNYVVVGGQRYSLSTPSADQSGLKLQVHQKLEAGVAYSILLDFDANQSIHQTGNGQYKLKPVIRTIQQATSGSIKGSISPVGINATVTATANGVSYSSIVNADGKFIIQGLPDGTYDLVITPDAPFAVSTKTGIVVQTGITTNIGVIVF